MTDHALLNLTTLTPWLEKNLPNFKGPVEATKFEGGQSNPTFKLEAPQHSYVLRRKPPCVLLRSAHGDDREFRVQSALQGTSVPVAKMHILCQDSDILGADFYIMDHIHGRNFDDPRLTEVSQDQRGLIQSEMNRVLADIHSVDLNSVGLNDFGPTGNYFSRQTERWSKQYHASETETIEPMNELINWLATNMPPDDGQRTLVHGDYRIDNMLFHPTDARCLAVLDWELSTTGHPFADLAAVIMQWSMPTGSKGRGLRDVDRRSLGLMEDQEFIDNYCQRRNIAGIDNFGFYLAFCFFRMAAILQGVKKRALDGNASNPERALELGRMVPDFADLGLKAATTV